MKNKIVEIIELLTQINIIKTILTIDKLNFRSKKGLMNNPNSFWLINSKRTEVKRYIKDHKCEDRFFEYMFIDSGEIIGITGDKPPLMKTRVSVKTAEAIENYKRLLA